MPQDPNASLSSVRSAPQSCQITASIHRPSRQAQTHTLFLSPYFSPSNTRMRDPHPPVLWFPSDSQLGVPFGALLQSCVLIGQLVLL